MAELFWTVFGLALALCVAPGPITVETIRRGLRDGFWPALGIQAGALAAELAWAVAVLWGLAPLAQFPAVRTIIAVAGTGFLLWMAWQALRHAPPAPVHGVKPRSTRSAALAGAVCAGSNPLAAMFWLAVAALLGAQGVSVLHPEHCAVVGAAYVLAALSWGVPVAAAAAWGARLMRPRLWRWWNIASGIALGAYGLQLLWSTLWL